MTFFFFVSSGGEGQGGSGCCLRGKIRVRRRDTFTLSVYTVAGAIQGNEQGSEGGFSLSVCLVPGGGRGKRTDR